MNGVVGFVKSLTYENLINYLFDKLYIYLEISILGYRWRITMIVVEIAWELGESKLISLPFALSIVAYLTDWKCILFWEK